jgi:hypothetical protein
MTVTWQDHRHRGHSVNSGQDLKEQADALATQEGCIRHACVVMRLALADYHESPNACRF